MSRQDRLTRFCRCPPADFGFGGWRGICGLHLDQIFAKGTRDFGGFRKLLARYAALTAGVRRDDRAIDRKPLTLHESDVDALLHDGLEEIAQD